MKFNFKKIASVLASTVMIGSTVAFAAAAYPAPLVQNGVADVAVVYGGQAAETDRNQALALGADLEEGISAPAAGVGSESVLIKASGDMLNYGQDLDDVEASLKKADLPNLLADGTVRDDGDTNSGDEYEYDQELVLFGDSVEYNTLDRAEDYVVNTDMAAAERPIFMIDQSADQIWNLTVDFDDELAAGDLDDNEQIEIAGTTFTFDPEMATDEDTLSLYASSEVVVISVGETVTIAGVTIEVAGANTDTDEANLRVNGKLEDVEQGDTVTTDDDVDLYISEIYTQTVPTETAMVEVFVGADKIEIEVDANVDVVVNDETLEGMTATIVGTNVGDIEEITFMFAPSDLESETNEQDSLEIGESIVDPLFGTVAMVFDSVDPEVMEDKDPIMFERSGSDLLLTFNNLDGDEYAIDIYTGNSTNVTLEEDLFDIFGSATFNDIVDEQILILQEGNSAPYITKILQVKTIDDGSDDEVTFKDLATGELFNVDADKEILDTGAFVCGSGGGANLTDEAFDLEDAACASGTIVDVIDEIYTESDTEIVLGDPAGAGATITINEDADNIGEDADVSEDTITVDITTDGDDDIKMGNLGLTGPSFQDDDADFEYGMTEFGTYMELELENEGSSFNLYVPEEEQVFNVYISAGTVDGGAAAIPVIQDSQVESYSDNNLAIIGGTCINDAAAMQLTDGANLCGPDFTAKTGVGAGQYIIDVAASAYNAEKLAVVIAGYNAPDTENGVNAFMEGAVEIAAGESEVFPQASA